ncbi:MAG: PRC-barrel domain-containing protein [Candidatus Nanoarchaeia archaeon]
MAKKITQISSKEYNLEKEFKLKVIIGKRVIANDGQELGKVKDVIIKDLSVIGVIFSRHLGLKYFVDRSHIYSLTPEAVILKIKPYTSLLGLQVLDKNGRILGKVKDVKREDTSNNIKDFTVKVGFFKKATFKASDIDIISDRLILNKEYTE